MFVFLIYVGYIALWILLIFLASFISWRLFRSKVVTTIAGLVAFGVMYWPAFGDLVPTLVTHKQLCEREAGFIVFLTPEQWAVENPDVVEELVPYENIKVEGNIFVANDRFGSSHEKFTVYGESVQKLIDTVVDLKTGNVLLEYTDFSRGYGSYGVGLDNRSIKVWLYAESCFSKKKLMLLNKDINNFKTKLKFK